MTPNRSQTETSNPDKGIIAFDVAPMGVAGQIRFTPFGKTTCAGCTVTGLRTPASKASTGDRLSTSLKRPTQHVTAIRFWTLIGFAALARSKPIRRYRR